MTSNRRSRRRAVGLLLAIALSVCGCGLLQQGQRPAAVTYLPSRAGVVDSVESWDVFTLASGERIDVSGGPDEIHALGPSPQVGYLYVGGDSPQRWVDFIEPSPYPDCGWQMLVTGNHEILWDEPNAVIRGQLELRKASSFHELSTPRSFGDHLGWEYIAFGAMVRVCVNDEGEVVSAG